MSPEARAAEGATLLDERVPDWFTRIDTEILDIASGKRCVLGQLYGDYTTGAKELNLSVGVWHYGFTSATPALTDSWVHEIHKRQAVPAERERELVLA